MPGVLAPRVASAGTAQSDASSDPFKAAKAYYDYLGEHAPGMIAALVVSKAFRGKAVAFRPTTHDGVFNALFRTEMIATVNIQALNR